MKQFLLFGFCLLTKLAFSSLATVDTSITEPVILSVSPTTVTQGDTVDFTIIGRHTHFTKGTKSHLFNAGGNGVYPLSTQVVNDTMVILKYMMYYQLNPDSLSICVYDSMEYMCKFNCIRLHAGPYPPSFTITPNSAIQGETVQMTIKGTNTHFKNYTGNNAIILSHTSGSPNLLAPMEYTNDSLLKVTFTLDYRNRPGEYDFSVNDSWPSPPLTLPKGFTLHAGLYPPQLLSCSPDTVSQGDHVTMRIRGRNTHFLTGVTVVSLYTPALGIINLSTTHILNDSTIDADFTFGYNNLPGRYTLHVENQAKDGYLQLPDAVTLKPGSTPPVLKSISPAFARKGEQIKMYIIGDHTSFANDNEVRLFNVKGNEIVANKVERIHKTVLIASFTFSSSDSMGTYSLKITNTSPALTLTDCFTLYEAGASILSVSPSAASIGDSVQLTIHSLNAHYLLNSNRVWLKSIYDENLLYGKQVTAINDSTLKANFVFSDSLFIGKYSVFVYNITDDTVKLDSAFLLKNGPQTPRITNVTPNAFIYESTATITIEASGTHFQQGADSIKLNQWFFDTFPVSMKIVNDTVMTAIFKFPAFSQLPLMNKTFMDIVIWGKNRLALPYGIILFYPVPVPEVKKEEDVLLYPNPSRGLFYIELGPDNQLRELEVMDVLGNIIQRKHLLTETVELDLSSQPAGVYYIRFLGDTTAKTEKLIKLE